MTLASVLYLFSRLQVMPSILSFQPKTFLLVFFYEAGLGYISTIMKTFSFCISGNTSISPSSPKDSFFQI